MAGASLRRGRRPYRRRCLAGVGSLSLRWFLVASLAATAGCTTGHILVVDPFTDELAHQPPVTTPSATAVRAADVRVEISHRPYQPMPLEAKDGSVTHGALYYEDPFEDKGSDDGVFAWTREDYLYWFLGPARWLINTASFPFSAVRTPPWLVMESDGRSVRPVPADARDRRGPGDRAP